MSRLYSIIAFVLMLVLSWSGCMSSAQFAVCGNGEMEPTEECSPNWDGTPRAQQACIDRGYSGGSATCRDTDCTWDLSTCTGTTNNVNNNSIECDPLQPSSGCGGEVCYFDPDNTCATCRPTGIEQINNACGEPWDCAPGLTCLWGVCTKICDRFEEYSCIQDLPCYDPGWPNVWGFCPLVGDDVCNPISGTGCPDPDHGCYVVNENGVAFTTACLHSTTNTGGCMEDQPYSDNYYNQCSPGYYCVGSNCRKFCIESDDCLSGTCVLVYEAYLDDLDVMVCM